MQNCNGPMCDAQLFLESCGKRGNLLAKALGDNWDNNLPQVMSFSNTTDIQARSLRPLGATGKGVARNLVPQMLKDRFGSVPGPFSGQIPAAGAQPLDVDLIVEFPDVWEFAAMHRISYTQNVDDQPIEVERQRTQEDTSGAAPRVTSTIYTSSPLECSGNSRISTNALIFNSSDLGGVGIPIPVVAQYGPTVQTLAAFVAQGQKNAANDFFTGPENAGVQVTSLSASHRWMCELFQGLDILQGSDMSEREYKELNDAKARFEAMIAELKGLQGQFQPQLAAMAQNGANGVQMAPNGLYTNGNAGPVQAPNGYHMQPNGQIAPQKKRRVFVAPNGQAPKLNGGPNQPRFAVQPQQQFVPQMQPGLQAQQPVPVSTPGGGIIWTAGNVVPGGGQVPNNLYNPYR